MNAVREAIPMAKKRAPEQTERPTVAVKVDRAIVNKAKMVATDKGLNLSDYISAALAGVVDRDWDKMVRRAAESVQ